jgi:thiamine-monophosphate kinase
VRSEFQFIEHIKSKYSLDKVGDDCAVLPKNDTIDLLITADLLVEDIDFRLEWTTPEFLGHKALAVSLSDIAAMGGEPKWALLSIGVSEKLWKTDFLDRFYGGWHELARKYDVELIGGDVSRSPDTIVVDSVVGGEVPKGKAIRRSGAKPGDAILVTGYLGGAAAGLRLLESGTTLDLSSPAEIRHLLLRQLQPLPQVDTAKLLQQHGLATSLIDISDGLSSDLMHVLNAGHLGARIHRDCVPVDPAIAATNELGQDAFELALHGGEDFELLLTVDRERAAEALDLGFHEIGEVTQNTGLIESIDGGQKTILEPKGFQHFR